MHAQYYKILVITKHLHAPVKYVSVRAIQGHAYACSIILTEKYSMLENYSL